MSSADIAQIQYGVDIFYCPHVMHVWCVQVFLSLADKKKLNIAKVLARSDTLFVCFKDLQGLAPERISLILRRPIKRAECVPSCSVLKLRANKLGFSMIHYFQPFGSRCLADKDTANYHANYSFCSMKKGEVEGLA